MAVPKPSFHDMTTVSCLHGVCSKARGGHFIITNVHEKGGNTIPVRKKDMALVCKGLQ